MELPKITYYDLRNELEARAGAVLVRDGASGRAFSLSELRRGAGTSIGIHIDSEALDRGISEYLAAKLVGGLTGAIDAGSSLDSAGRDLEVLLAHFDDARKIRSLIDAAFGQVLREKGLTSERPVSPKIWTDVVGDSAPARAGR